MDYIFRVLIVFVAFMLGLLCVNNPFAIVRFLAWWLKFASGSLLESFKVTNPMLKEVYELIDTPSAYMDRFPEQINQIRGTGFILIFVATLGMCIFMCGDTQ